MPTPSLILVPARFKTGKLYTPVATTSGGTVLGASGDFNVTRATTATRVNASGYIESVASGIPRLDYFASGGTVGCPALLVEPSGSNLLLQSAGFEVSGTWSPTNNTITTGSTAAFTAPDGTTNADLLTSTSSISTSSLTQTITVASGTSSISVFAKAGNYGLFRIGNVSSAARAAWFNLDAGVVTGTVNGGSASMQNYGNGWYRCIFTPTTTVSGSDAFIIGISNAPNGTTGVSGSTIYFWGAQLETGSVATSYIPTTTGSVTRNADVISVSGAVSGSIGQTEGTIYAEVDVRNITAVKNIISTDDGNSLNRVSLFIDPSPNRITAVISSGGTGTFVSGSITTGVHKIAVSYSSSDVQVFLNGGFLASGVPTLFPSVTRNNLSIGGRIVSGAYGAFLNDRIRAAALYTTRLTNDQLASLTTP